MMISNLKNPKELVICLKFLIHLSLTDEESAQSIKSIITKHIGVHLRKMNLRLKILLPLLDDRELIKLTIESFIHMQEEEEVTKRESC